MADIPRFTLIWARSLLLTLPPRFPISNAGSGQIVPWLQTCFVQHDCLFGRGDHDVGDGDDDVCAEHRCVDTSGWVLRWESG